MCVYTILICGHPQDKRTDTHYFTCCLSVCNCGAGIIVGLAWHKNVLLLRTKKYAHSREQRVELSFVFLSEDIYLKIYIKRQSFLPSHLPASHRPVCPVRAQVKSACLWPKIMCRIDTEKSADSLLDVFASIFRAPQNILFCV